MEEENIHLQLVTNVDRGDAPTQIMEADEDTNESTVEYPIGYQPRSNHHISVHKNGILGEMNVISDGITIGCHEHDHFVKDTIQDEEEINLDKGLKDFEDIVSNQASNSQDQLKYEENRDFVDSHKAQTQQLHEYENSSNLVSSKLDPVDRVSNLENELKLNKSRLDGFSQELKILLVEVNIVCDWIREKFGVELINKTSVMSKHIYDAEEMERLSQSLSFSTQEKSDVRRSNRKKLRLVKDIPTAEISAIPKSKRGRGRPKKKVESGEDSETALLIEDPKEESQIFDPPECVLHTDVEDDFFKDNQDLSKSKIKRVRRRVVKKIKEEKIESLSYPSVPVSEEALNPEVKEIKTTVTNDESVPKKKKKWKAQPRSLQCEECGKILKADSSLRWHMLMHADLRPVECLEPGCGKTFRDKSKLAQHQKIHNGEKSEKCRYCDRGFLRKKDLVVHERTHTGEKPYKCPNCIKAFNIKDHLTIHLRVHTGEKPYKCPTCAKAFSQANSLRIHKKIHLKQNSDYIPTPRKPRAARKHKNSILPSVKLETSTPSLSIESGLSLMAIETNHREEVIGNETKLLGNLQDNDHLPITMDLSACSSGTTTAVQASHSVHQNSPSSSSTLVHTFFHPQALNLLDPVQQTWNFTTNSNVATSLGIPGTSGTQTNSSEQPHQSQDSTQVQQHHVSTHLSQQHSSHQQQRLNPQNLETLSHLSVIPGPGQSFKLQPITYHSTTIAPVSQHHQPRLSSQLQAASASTVSIIRNPSVRQTTVNFLPTSQFQEPGSFRHFP